MSDKRHVKDIHSPKVPEHSARNDSFVLEKSIFSNIFEKDIRRVYIYKKSERLAKAIHLVGPAFRNSPALRDRTDRIAVGLVDAAILPPLAAREALSRELLALSSVLAIARTGGLLSAMNSDLIITEAHTLLQEIAAYEEPRLFLDEAPSLASLFKSAEAGKKEGEARAGLLPTPGSLLSRAAGPQRTVSDTIGQPQGHAGPRPTSTMDAQKKSTRQEAILAVVRTKGKAYIKDISTVIRNVSEKTIQRELQSLVAAGILAREGERRWTTYSLVT